MAALYFFTNSIVSALNKKTYSGESAVARGLVPPSVNTNIKLPIIKPREHQSVEVSGTAVVKGDDEVVGILPVDKGQRTYTNVPAPSNQVFGAEPVRAMFLSGKPEPNTAAMERIVRDASLPVPNNEWGEAVQDLTAFTSQDTKVDKIEIDGQKVDRNIVKSAIFDNANYAPRDETKLVPKMITVDRTVDPPYSHFGPIDTVLGPVPYMNHAMKDALINDVILDGSRDNRVVISDTGARKSPAVFIAQ
jgi:hypothetical protein